MQSLIHFRSHIEGHVHGDTGPSKLGGRAMEIRGIRSYVSGDDPRDIAWKKGSGNMGLYTKDRESPLHPEVILLSTIEEKNLDFQTESGESTKRHFLDTLRTRIRESSHFSGFPYREILLREVDTNLSGEKIEGELMRLKHTIILIIGDLERERYADIMEKIPKGNDTIFLLLLHPLECDTQRDGQSILFESQVISESYRRALQEEMTYREYDCSSRQIAFLSTTTEENPSLFLNHFFKYRYA